MSVTIAAPNKLQAERTTINDRCVVQHSGVVIPSSFGIRRCLFVVPIFRRHCRFPPVARHRK